MYFWGEPEIYTIVRNFGTVVSCILCTIIKADQTRFSSLPPLVTLGKPRSYPGSPSAPEASRPTSTRQPRPRTLEPAPRRTQRLFINLEQTFRQVNADRKGLIHYANWRKPRLSNPNLAGIFRRPRSKCPLCEGCDDRRGLPRHRLVL